MVYGHNAIPIFLRKCDEIASLWINQFYIVERMEAPI